MAGVCPPPAGADGLGEEREADAHQLDLLSPLVRGPALRLLAPQLVVAGHLERDAELYPTFLPGMGRLFRQETEAFLDDVVWNGAGDVATMELPYGTFRYEVTGTRIVDDDDLSVLAPTDREILRLQACHPRFRATQRIIVSARLADTVTADA